MFADIRRFIELLQQSNYDCINSYKPFIDDDKKEEPKGYFTENSICLSQLNIPDEFK